ncbi:MAG: hypothetical protein EON58_04195 [Alphaproteobacteria bacterium]|nr:MAG: hypothetical protein EON58_04195 [Alphaproteobacteria bacterium]
MVALHCIDTSGVGKPLLPGAVSVGFQECGSYRFIPPMDGASLYIDEAPLELVPHDGTTCWLWEPGFYAGQVVAELVALSGQRIAEYRFDVAPDDRKIGGDLFDQMLDELYAFDPALLLGTEAAQASIGVAGDVVSPMLAYARLRRHGGDLLAGLGAVSAQPLTKLRRERTLVPFHRVRRLDVASVRNLLRRPDTAAFLRREAALADGAIPLFDVLHSIEELDNPANRALTAILLAVRRRSVQVAGEIHAMAAREEEEGARTPLKPRLVRKLQFLTELIGKLGKMSRRTPYASVSRPEVTAAGLNAISAHPSYARAYRFAWSILRPGVAGEARDESLWLSPTWEIYERWCFTRVAACLRNRYSDLTWAMKYPGTLNDRIRLVGVGPAMRIEASLQSCFRSGGMAVGGLRSVSLQLQPDILITIESGGERRMLVLDAKYRTSRQNVLDAMRSAHLYQDALRWDGRRSDCSLLIVPRGGGAPWLEEPEFHKDHRVGVHILAPDSPSSGLDEMLGRWLTLGPHA